VKASERNRTTGDYSRGGDAAPKRAEAPVPLLARLEALIRQEIRA
jgi:hypothetical protein